jgi:ribokinase
MGVRRAAVVTLGALGSVVATADGEFHLPPLPVAARDTTAAGDAYVGGLAAALAAGADFWAALRVANVAAGLSVTRLGAMNSLPARAEVEAALPGPEPIRL